MGGHTFRLVLVQQRVPQGHLLPLVACLRGQCKYRSSMDEVGEHTCTVETRQRILVWTLCGKVIALAKTTDDLSGARLCEVALHRLFGRIFGL